MPPINSRRLAFPKIINPEAPPIRPGRHVANSIATIRRHLIVALEAPWRDVPAATRRAKPPALISLYEVIRLSDGLIVYGFRLIATAVAHLGRGGNGSV